MATLVRFGIRARLDRCSIDSGSSSSILLRLDTLVQVGARRVERGLSHAELRLPEARSRSSVVEAKGVLRSARVRTTSFAPRAIAGATGARGMLRATVAGARYNGQP
jgi:hypothetical protein